MSMTVPLAILLVLLQIPDITTTNAILRLGGRELNPVMRFFMRLLGRWWWLPKILLTVPAAAVLALADDVDSLVGLGILNIVYGLVVLSNLRQLRRRRRALGLSRHR